MKTAIAEYISIYTRTFIFQVKTMHDFCYSKENQRPFQNFL